ncbi:MAG: type IV conjugative transfer system coupling protein TraD [Pseudomonadota bacterium]
MGNNHPIEALLRPPVELSACLIVAGCACLAWIGPEWFLLTPTVGRGAAIALCLVSLYWLARGVRVVRYQRNLKRLKRFTLADHKIPVSPNYLYLGKGFRWGEKHTQRLHDSRRAKTQKYVQPNRFYRWVRRNEARWESTFLHSWTRADHWSNPFRPLPEGGGLTTLHGVEVTEHDVRLPLTDRTGHTLVLGTTRVGKSVSLLLMARQDILRGDVVIVIDPKGDADILKGIEAAAKEADREFHLFHLGFPESSARYNAIANFSRITEVASRTTGQLSGEGNSAVFREFAWRFVNVVARAITAIGEVPNYETILKHVMNIDELLVAYARQYFAEDMTFIANKRERMESNEKDDYARVPNHLEGRSVELIAIEMVLTETGGGDEILAGLRSATKYERTYFDKIVASLLPLLEKLTTGKTAQLLSPDYLADEDDRKIFTWEGVVKLNAVVYIGLDALSDPAVAAAVGNSMLADLVSFTGKRYKRGATSEVGLNVAGDLSRINLHADEVNELMGDEFIPMVNKGGGSGLQVTAYTQTLADVEVKVGTSAKAQQVTGNFNNLIMFRVKGVETARLLTDQLPEVAVETLTWLAGYNDSSDVNSGIEFSSRHEDRVTTTQSTMLEPHDVMKLPRGHAFVLIEGGHLYKTRLPRLISRSDDSNYEKIVDSMVSNYRTGSNWWLANDTD